MNLNDWLGYIESIHPSTIDLTLERIKIVLERLNLNVSFPILTIGGTNGKGSTCSILESIYKEAGYKVACYTSPHFLNFNERIKIQTLAVSDEVIEDVVFDEENPQEPEIELVTEIEEIKVITKLEMPSRKLKINISKELLSELEKMQVNFKLN